MPLGNLVVKLGIPVRDINKTKTESIYYFNEASLGNNNRRSISGFLGNLVVKLGIPVRDINN